MKFWQSLAFCELDQAVELAKFAEELGFHGVSFGDHLVTTKTGTCRRVPGDIRRGGRS